MENVPEYPAPSSWLKSVQRVRALRRLGGGGGGDVQRLPLRKLVPAAADWSGSWLVAITALVVGGLLTVPLVAVVLGAGYVGTEVAGLPGAIAGLAPFALGYRRWLPWKLPFHVLQVRYTHWIEQVVPQFAVAADDVERARKALVGPGLFDFAQAISETPGTSLPVHLAAGRRVDTDCETLAEAGKLGEEALQRAGIPHHFNGGNEAMPAERVR